MTKDNELEMSEFDFSDANPLAEVIEIADVFPHPNADLLDLVSPDGSGVNFAIVKKGQFKKGDKAVWIDSVNEAMVPTSLDVFAFLKKSAKADGYAKIKAMKLRGVISRGLIIPLPAEFSDKTSRELSESLGLKKYIIQNYNRVGGSFVSGHATSGPSRYYPQFKYDVESLLKNWKSIPNGTEVILTEKIHGANGSFAWLADEFWVRSRTVFKKAPKEGTSGGLWWDVAERFDLKEKLKSHPGLILYGELFGNVQDLRYGKENEYAFAAFDCWDTNKNKYLTWDELTSLCLELDVPITPVVGRIVWNTSGGIPTEIVQMAEGMSLVPGADNIREGIVLRSDMKIPLEGTGVDAEPVILNQRFIYKLVGNGYLTR
jgi:RNA ligase (TIGR02306 family)